MAILKETDLQLTGMEKILKLRWTVTNGQLYPTVSNANSEQAASSNTAKFNSTTSMQTNIKNNNHVYHSVTYNKVLVMSGRSPHLSRYTSKNGILCNDSPTLLQIAQFQAGQHTSQHKKLY
jgi:hypothetical protein